MVRRDLLDQELVVGQVLIERADHVVPVGVGERIAPLLGKYITLGIGVAGYIQPVPSPAFAVVRRGQQAIDDFREGIGGAVGLKRGDFLKGRR